MVVARINAVVLQIVVPTLGAHRARLGRLRRTRGFTVRAPRPIVVAMGIMCGAWLVLEAQVQVGPSAVSSTTDSADWFPMLDGAMRSMDGAQMGVECPYTAGMIDLDVAAQPSGRAW